MNSTSYRRDRARPCPQKKLHIKSNRRTTARVVPTVANFFKFDEMQAPSDEGAVERSETEGEKAINIKFSLSLPQSFFFEKRQLPRQREPEIRLSVNVYLIPQCIVYQNNVYSVLMARKSCYKELAADRVGRLAIKAGACF